MKTTLLIALVGLITAGCLGSDFTDSVEGSWQLTSGVVDGEEIPLLDSHPITMTFDEDEVSGTAACNTYRGPYSLSGTSIEIGGVALTEMGCFPEEVMEAEAMFANSLTRVETVTVDQGLVLSGDDVELVFEMLEAVPDADLTGVEWVLDAVVDGDSVSTPTLDTRATIEFSNGTVTGDTGCRPFSGTYTISGSEVLVDELAADGHQCEPDLAGQDDHFLAVVGDGFQVEIEGSRLTLSSQGGLGLSFLSGA